MKFCRVACWVLLGAYAISPGPSYASDREFPYDRELMLDANPMRGSKRVPVLEIDANGQAAIDLWCNSVTAQFVVAQDTITILTGQKTERACPPDRQRGDEDMLSALSEVTTWRRNGAILDLIGPKRLRFRLTTN